MPGYRFIDLSHTVVHGMVTYKGLPGTGHLRLPHARAHRGNSTHPARSSTSAASTWWRTPAPTWMRPSTVTPTVRTWPNCRWNRLAHLDAVVVRRTGPPSAPKRSRRSTFAARRCSSTPDGIATGGPPRIWKATPFSPAAPRDCLREGGAALVGIDSHNIDDTGDLTRPAHSILLGAGIPVCEHLCNLDAVPDFGFRFSAVPVKVKAFGTFPVRAFALLEEA